VSETNAVADTRILVIPGSLRRASLNKALGRAAAEVAPPLVAVDVADLAGIPLYDDDVYAQGMPEAVAALRRRVAEADAVLIVTPEYNFSYPGVLKNAIDWLSRGKDQPFRGKPTAMASVAAGALGGIRAQVALREVLHYLETDTLERPELVVGGANGKFDASGKLTDEPTRAQLAKVVAAIAERVARSRALQAVHVPA
jgi:chromate reductase